MPKLTKSEDVTPEGFRPYLFHGVDLTWKDGDKNASADCVLCSRSSKFHVEATTTKFHCKKCGSGSNAIEFIRLLYEMSLSATKSYRELCDNRKLMNPDTLLHWGVARSIASGDWLLPGFNLSKAIIQVYRYRRTWENGKERMALMPTPTLGHGLFGVPLYDPDKPKVYVCEGPWDAMALWEILGQVKDTGQGFVSTGSDVVSLRAEANVLAVPTCTVFFGKWLPLFSGKIVVLMFDSDHPRTHPDTGKLIEPAGYNGMKRIAGMLSSSKNPPAEIHYLNWGEGGYDATLPSGYDVRDFLSTHGISEALSRVRDFNA